MKTEGLQPVQYGRLKRDKTALVVMGCGRSIGLVLCESNINRGLVRTVSEVRIMWYGVPSNTGLPHFVHRSYLAGH